jgi:hypothetical protein
MTAAASSPEDSGTQEWTRTKQAPEFDWMEGGVMADDLDAADRAAGYVRLDLTDPTWTVAIANLMAQQRYDGTAVDEAARQVIHLLQTLTVD